MSDQFIGRFYHALEQKGRLSIPTSFRGKLGKTPVLTSGLDGCLLLLSQAEWDKATQNALSKPYTKKNTRDWLRYLANNASEVSFDALGRILIPEFLRIKARITKETVIVGSISKVEIWDRDSYHQYFELVNKQAEQIAEALDDVS